MRSNRGWWVSAVLVCFGLVFGQRVVADDTLKPFVLASKSQEAVGAVVEATKAKLVAGGFEVVGEYAPYDTAHVFGVSNEALRKAAAQSEFGGYAAVQRVSVTKVGDEVQVAYTNPEYMAHAYRLAADLKGVGEQMKAALGKQQEFGPAEGLTPKQLRKYHYMLGMEYFDDPSTLAEYANYADAVAAVETALAAHQGGVTKVYRVDIPGKQETVFGVSLSQECSGDTFVMGNIDFKPLRSTPHLPYEMLVSGNKVYALYARFRIAINFPDLKMMGDNSFFKIMCAPGAIEGALKAAAGKPKVTPRSTAD